MSPGIFELRQRSAVTTCAATPTPTWGARSRLSTRQSSEFGGVFFCRAAYLLAVRHDTPLVHGLARGQQLGRRAEVGKKSLLPNRTRTQKLSAGGRAGMAGGRVGGPCSERARPRNLAQPAGTASQHEEQVDHLHLQLVRVQREQEVRGREGRRRCHKTEG